MLQFLRAKGQNQRLGQTMVIGSRVWDQQGSFILVIGQVKIQEFRDFSPFRGNDSGL